jgi:hypothetical protein
MAESGRKDKLNLITRRIIGGQSRYIDIWVPVC